MKCYCGSPAHFPCRTCGRTQPEQVTWKEEPDTKQSTRKGGFMEPTNPGPRYIGTKCGSISPDGRRACMEPAGHQGMCGDSQETWMVAQKFPSRSA